MNINNKDTDARINLISVGLILATNRLSKVEFIRMLNAANELNRQQTEGYSNTRLNTPMGFLPQ